MGAPMLALKALWSKYSDLNSNSGRTSLTVVTFVANAFLGVLTGFLAARLLGPQGIGELTAIRSWSIIIGTVAALGMSDAVIYFGKRYPAQATTYLVTAFIPVGLSVGISIFVGWWLMPLLLHAQTREIIDTARLLIVIMTPIFGMIIVYESLRAYDEWKIWNLLRFTASLFWLMVLIIAFLVPLWANSILLSKLWSLMFLLPCIPAILIVKIKYAPPPIKVNPAFIKPLLGFGIPVMATTLPQMLNLRLDQLIMASFLPARSLGFYVTAVSWSFAASSIFSALSQVLFPQISSLSTLDQKKRTVSRSILVSSLLGILLTALLFVLTPILVPLLFGSSYRPAIPVALLLVVASWFGNMNFVLESVLRGLGKPRKVLLAELIGLVITVVLLYLLLPKYEIMGAGIASLAAYAGIGFVSGFFIWQEVFKKKEDTLAC